MQMAQGSRMYQLINDRNNFYFLEKWSFPPKIATFPLSLLCGPHLPSLFTCCGHFVYHWCFWVVYISCSKNLYFLGLIQTNQISPNLLLIQFLGYWEITLPNSILPGRKRNVLYSLHDFNLKVTSSSTTGRSVKSHTYNTLYDLAFQRDVAVPTLIVRLHWCHCKVQIINTSVVFRIANNGHASYRDKILAFCQSYNVFHCSGICLSFLVTHQVYLFKSPFLCTKNVNMLNNL